MCTDWTEIRYANVSRCLCFIFYLCLLVSNMFGLARSFDLAVRKFMRRHHPGVRRPCLEYQRGGRRPLSMRSSGVNVGVRRERCHMNLCTTFDLVVRKFMRRHHPGVLRPCLRYQRGGRRSLFDAIISRERSLRHRCKLLHG